MAGLIQAFKVALDALFPNFCLGCKGHIESNQSLCPHCMDDLALFDLARHPNLLHRPDICDAFPDCHFDHLIACAWYQAPYKQWLIQLKFNNQQHYKVALQQIITKQLQHALAANTHWPDVFIIMPLHKRRFLSRGYNQVSQTWLQVLEGLQQDVITPLHKQKATQPQSKLSKTKRVKNVKNAFVCQQDLTGKSVAIVDDVMTSGATLNAATEALKQAGAKQVWAILTCLTPLN